MCFAINTAKHESKGYTPAFLNYGRELLAPGSITRESTDVTAPVDEERQSQLAAELRKLPAISTDVTAPVDEERQSQLAAELRKLPAIFERARRESTDVTAPVDEERQSQLAAELRKLPAIFERARRKMAESF
ncbi:hypothetical protein QE152_g37618 [Popillia japonica]|uniref:Uncharacterized protein n=1 Tax=Popillia japonica TaxID=7064 RepID=A0AAW1I9K2_POPJA